METIPPATPVDVIQDPHLVYSLPRQCAPRALLSFSRSHLGPLIVWLLKRGESAEIDAHGKESLNFQLSMLIYDAVAAILCFVLIGIPILILLWVLNTVLVIVASVKASEGELIVIPSRFGLLSEPLPKARRGSEEADPGDFA